MVIFLYVDILVCVLSLTKATLFLLPFPCSCSGSFLCFERSKSHSAKNLRLPLKEARVEKANSYPWIPGGGMAMEVSVDGKVGGGGWG